MIKQGVCLEGPIGLVTYTLSVTARPQLYSRMWHDDMPAGQALLLHVSGKQDLTACIVGGTVFIKTGRLIPPYL